MKKFNKLTRRITLSALAALTFGGIALSTTYALFTSEATTDVSVSTGKVKVSTQINDDVKLYSLNGTTDDSVLIESKTAFTGGGTFKYDNDKGTITLDKFLPGDKVEFSITAKNESNVNIKYRTVLKTVEDNGLFQGLVVKINDVEYDGSTTVSNYEALDAGADFTTTKYNFSIELPKTAGNEYQEKKCTVSFKIEAIQGNAKAENPDQTKYEIYTPLDLAAFAKKVNNNAALPFTKAILMNDIDMTGIKYVSPNYAMPVDKLAQFEFDGQGYTISHFAPSEADDGSNNKYIGLIGKVGVGKVYVHNVKFDDVTMKGDFTTAKKPHLGAGTVVGLTDAGASELKIENIQLNGGVNISDVKYAGGIVGYTSCTTTIDNYAYQSDTASLSISGYTAGGVIGQVGGKETTLKNIKFESEVLVNGSHREGGLIGAGSGANIAITCDTDYVKKYVKISEKADTDRGMYIGLHTNKTIEGVKYSTTINGTPYYTASSSDELNGIVIQDKTKAAIVEIGEGTYNGYSADFKSVTGGVKVVGRGEKNNIVWIQALESNTGNCGYSFDGTKVQMENLTLTVSESAKGYYTGFPQASSTSFNNVKILVDHDGGAMGYWGDGAVEFTNCEFNSLGASESNIFTYGGKSFTFKGCTFLSDETALKLYRNTVTDSSYVDVNIIVNGCVFDNKHGSQFTGDKNYKSAIQVACDKNGDMIRYKVVVNNSTVSGNYAEGLYQKWIGARYANCNGQNATVNSNNLTFTLDGTTPTLVWGN